MPLTVVVGSSGSGKTTFLQHVYEQQRQYAATTVSSGFASGISNVKSIHKSIARGIRSSNIDNNKNNENENESTNPTGSHRRNCVYIRQYHMLRPYITVSKIPHFDPTKLPYWDLYVNDIEDDDDDHPNETNENAHDNHHTNSHNRKNKKKNKAEKIKVGGTLAGNFTAGLSGGQRKMLVLELLCQRLLVNDNPNPQQQQQQNDISSSSGFEDTSSYGCSLVLLDEPFAGVTDDFVPYLMSCLQRLSAVHNVIVSTNDHIDVCLGMATNVVTVSSVDRTTVQLNELQSVNRQKAIQALVSFRIAPAITTNTTTAATTTTTVEKTQEQEQQENEKAWDDGKSNDEAAAATTTNITTATATATSRESNWSTTTRGELWKDVYFLWHVEVWTNSQLVDLAVYTIIAFAIFTVTFWDSHTEASALVLIAASLIVSFAASPYLWSLVDWRNTVAEESQALLLQHSNFAMSRRFKLIFTIGIMVSLSTVEYIVVNVVLSGALLGFEYWLAMVLDFMSISLPLVTLGLYTQQPFEVVQVLGSLPFLLTVFFSTTFSPGAGVAGIKGLRYTFSQFYFWCMVPSVQDYMEGCPTNHTLLLVYMVLSSFLGVALIGAWLQWIRVRQLHHRSRQHTSLVTKLSCDRTFQQLQALLLSNHFNHQQQQQQEKEREMQKELHQQDRRPSAASSSSQQQHSQQPPQRVVSCAVVANELHTVAAEIKDCMSEIYEYMADTSLLELEKEQQEEEEQETAAISMEAATAAAADAAAASSAEDNDNNSNKNIGNTTFYPAQ